MKLAHFGPMLKLLFFRDVCRAYVKNIGQFVGEE